MVRRRCEKIPVKIFTDNRDIGDARGANFETYP